MGNGASSNVREIHIEQSVLKDMDFDNNNRKGSLPSRLVARLGSAGQARLRHLEDDLATERETLAMMEARALEAEERVKTLQTQMAEVEGANLELLDKVASLEQQVEMTEEEQNSKPEQDFSKTLRAKDLYIQKLEKETGAVTKEISKMREKYKKKMKSVMTQLAEAKQESALTVYSLKDEVTKLGEENSKLIAQLDKCNFLKDYNSPDTPTEGSTSEYDGGRTNLILELSAQVSAQADKISELEAKLAEKDRVIRELQKLNSSKGRVQSAEATKRLLKPSPRDDGKLDVQKEIESNWRTSFSRVETQTFEEDENYEELQKIMREMKAMNKKDKRKDKNGKEGAATASVESDKVVKSSKKHDRTPSSTKITVDIHREHSFDSLVEDSSEAATHVPSARFSSATSRDSGIADFHRGASIEEEDKRLKKGSSHQPTHRKKSHSRSNSQASLRESDKESSINSSQQKVSSARRKHRSRKEMLSTKELCVGPMLPDPSLGPITVTQAH
ncbi:CCDC192 [Branchiostoma lanceolatum]|uniref:CCDC192 protein n=1 Tax=Branchiostoma lanceolatum TaxID=7740 RepID=A0A8J9ZHM6_BRALA|nr:CCDC192 [Branchiostoma lanceolatum]